VQTTKSYNIVADQAATYELAVTWLDPNGNPVDLTHYTPAMQVRLGYNEPSVAATASIVNGGVTGVLTVTIDATQMAALRAPQTYVYDLRVQTGPTVYRLIEGTFTTVPAVTRG